MIRTTLQLSLIVLILGIPLILRGQVFAGQILFAALTLAFLGTLIHAIVDRPRNEP